MNRIVIAFSLSLLLFTPGCERRTYSITPTQDPNQPGQIYIPTDINDCFVELERMLTPKFVSRLKKGSQEDLIEHHMGLGMWMRNNWGLWRESRLQRYFIGLGVRHPDDMSGIILTCFWRHINGLPIELENQVETLNYYWQVHEEPNEPVCPEHSVPIKLCYSLTGEIVKGDKLLPRCIHVGRCSADDEFWVYEYGEGWYTPEMSIRKRIDELEAEGTESLFSAPIQKP